MYILSPSVLLDHSNEFLALIVDVKIAAIYSSST